ncbi:hypothetical protein TGVAND_364230 [Toxoplasma gondii VAND]|uniref:Uncharacterized protein n=1 Tax=Toxoplasma gondii VAND TaxID=933077 RepID=A0A086PJ25_TOXGO|nr:hypothetical protein TGVAND_364230 [Toxoplasma gondii VAND]
MPASSLPFSAPLSCPTSAGARVCSATALRSAVKNVKTSSKTLCSFSQQRNEHFAPGALAAEGPPPPSLDVYIELNGSHTKHRFGKCKASVLEFSFACVRSASHSQALVFCTEPSVSFLSLHGETWPTPLSPFGVSPSPDEGRAPVSSLCGLSSARRAASQRPSLSSAAAHS